MNNKLYFTFKETEELRNTPIEVLDLPDKFKFRLKRKNWWYLGDIIDNWDDMDSAVGKKVGLGTVSVANIHAAFFSYMVNEEKSDSVKLKDKDYNVYNYAVDRNWK